MYMYILKKQRTTADSDGAHRAVDSRKHIES